MIDDYAVLKDAFLFDISLSLLLRGGYFMPLSLSLEH